MSLDKDPHEREDQVVLRLLRTAIGKQGESLPGVDEETLTAYVMGTASPTQNATVQTALIGSAEFRQQVLDLMQISSGSFTEEERQAFKQAKPPSLEEVQKLAGLANELDLKAAPARRVVLKPDARHGWLEWVLGSWAVTATVAACALFVVMSRSTSPPAGPRLPKTQIPSQAAGSAGRQGASGTSGQEQPQAPITIGLVETIELRGLSRGGELKTPVARVRTLTRIIQLKAEPPDVPDGSVVRVTVTDPGGRLLVDEMLPVEDFSGTRAFVIQTQATFRPGRYVLAVVGHRGSLREEVSYPFAIKVDAH